MKNTKKIIHNLHLIFGIASGAIVFVLAVTGACWTFKDEVETVFAEKSTIQDTGLDFISPSKAKELASQLIPDKTIHGTAYGNRMEAVEVIFYEAEPVFYRSVFLHPYTGQFLYAKDHTAGFFGFVLNGHVNLWLPQSIGSRIASYGTLVFVFLLFSGIVLWWPKNKKNKKQRLSFQWKRTTQWRRKNFDLHSVLGFYVALFALVIAFSGLIMAFNWVYFLTYIGWGGAKAPQFIIPNSMSQTMPHTVKNKPIDALLPILLEGNPNYKQIEIHYPSSDSSALYAEISMSNGVYYDSDYRFFDQNSLKELETYSIYGKYSEASLADKVIRMNYDIHVGAIGGILGKILVFLASIVIASLPVSGVVLWWGRKKKSKTSKTSTSPSATKTKKERPQIPQYQ